MMNGKIKVESELGKGSKFYFYIELSKCENNDISVVNNAEVNISRLISTNNNSKTNYIQNEKPKKIYKNTPSALIVEDNEINRKLLMQILHNEGFFCECVENGKLAVKECLNKKYDIVFMDCQMPIMDGYRASALIRELSVSEEYTPIIAMTANAMKGDKEKCIQAGMTDYVSKPIDINILKLILYKYVGKQVNIKRVIEEKSALRFNDIVLRIVNELNFTKEMAEELVTDFIEIISESLDDLRNAIYAKDYSEIAKISHGIKGSASNLRVQDLANICFELEKNAKLKDLELCNNSIKYINNIYLKLHMDINKRDLKGESNG